MLKIKPFVKWAGGKSQFSKEILSIFPRKYFTYIEPFIGGGSIFFNEQPEKAIINDISNELMDAYRFFNADNKKSFFRRIFKIKKIIPPEEKFSYLLNLEREYNATKEKEKFFKKIRSQNPDSLNIDEKISRFIFLNKTCFNGLYRLNSKGEFNTPWNKKENLNVINLKNTKLISDYFYNSKIKIFDKDYLEILDLAKEGDFVFVDPPYDGDKTFTSYSIEKFNSENQKELASKLKELDKKGVKWILCNYPTDLIKELYKDYSCKEVNGIRAINSKSKARKNYSKELFFYNYKTIRGELNEG